MYKTSFSVVTAKYLELVDIHKQVAQAVRDSGIVDGICYVYNPHTTGAVTINEGADPTVQTDIVMALENIIPFKLNYRHMEGNSPSHVLASLFGASETLFVDQGRLVLGTWQKIYFCEFDGPRTRTVHVRVTAS
jgi:secondary thiamine-phosphate synthase enzyme